MVVIEKNQRQEINTLWF